MVIFIKWSFFGYLSRGLNKRDDKKRSERRYDKMNRKAQAQIITTVLIILLVLAAIVIVWQVISSTVERGGEEVIEATSCLNVRMKITSVTDENTINVQRESGGPSTAVGYKVLVDGTLQTIASATKPTLGQLEATDVDLQAPMLNTSAHDITVAGMVGNRACDEGTEYNIGACGNGDILGDGEEACFCADSTTTGAAPICTGSQTCSIVTGVASCTP